MLVCVAWRLAVGTKGGRQVELRLFLLRRVLLFLRADGLPDANGAGNRGDDEQAERAEDHGVVCCFGRVLVLLVCLVQVPVQPSSQQQRWLACG
jgi:hypothetical protein